MSDPLIPNEATANVVALISPSTSNLALGVLVPIPRSPDPSMYESAVFANNIEGVASDQPNPTESVVVLPTPSPITIVPEVVADDPSPIAIELVPTDTLSLPSAIDPCWITPWLKLAFTYSNRSRSP